MVTKLNTGGKSTWGCKPLSMNGQSLSNTHGASYDNAGKLHGKATGSWFNPVNLSPSVTLNNRPTAAPKGAAHPTVSGVKGVKGGVSPKG